ncbi:Sialate O-acetylesterase [Hypsibius exemplaris]|uniref:Sialate O-acetylesterase n=1 Tax=Hypsibius exemplaris TaxID=2072580 RepID=A0A1W0WXE7_HYPEX|nr:Sialate O-acetylesterase [Hypsibius exemplaris]
MRRQASPQSSKSGQTVERRETDTPTEKPNVRRRNRTSDGGTGRPTEEPAVRRRNRPSDGGTDHPTEEPNVRRRNRTSDGGTDHPTESHVPREALPVWRFWTRKAVWSCSLKMFVCLAVPVCGFVIFFLSFTKREFSPVILDYGLPHTLPDYRREVSSSWEEKKLEAEAGIQSPIVRNLRPRDGPVWHFGGGKWRNPSKESHHGRGDPSDDNSVVEFRFANYFQDRMVLQRGSPGAEIWGFGEPGQNVSLKFGGLELEGTVDDNSIWRIRLPPTEEGGPYEIEAWSRVEGTPEDIRIHSVLFGDVWLCSGQSNMEMRVDWMFSGLNELRMANSYDTIRFTEIMQSGSPTPVLEPLIRQGWSLPNSVTLKEFSAVCWAFGRRLQERLQIPIGLIGSYYGGTTIKAWSDSRVGAHCHEQVALHQSFKFGDDSVVWNAMMAPLLPLEIKGVLWYQGETDAINDYNSYLCMFPAMIESWRSHFRQPALPFGFVQLADIVGEFVGWPIVRWHQTADKGEVPNSILKNTFMAVAMDLPDEKSPHHTIHPRYKHEVAQRLLAGALNIAYNMSTTFKGPSPSTVSKINDSVLITFKEGPISLRGNLSSTFEICCGDLDGSNGTLNWANCTQWRAVTVSEHTNTSLTLDASVCQGKIVQFVRYAWKTTPCPFLECTIYGADSALPAGPFMLPLSTDTQQFIRLMSNFLNNVTNSTELNA